MNATTATTAPTWPETDRAAAPGKAPRPVVTVSGNGSANAKHSTRCGVCDSATDTHLRAYHCAECREPVCWRHVRTVLLARGGASWYDACCTLCAIALREAADAALDAGRCAACALAFGASVPCRCDGGTA